MYIIKLCEGNLDLKFIENWSDVFLQVYGKVEFSWWNLDQLSVIEQKSIYFFELPSYLALRCSFLRSQADGTTVFACGKLLRSRLQFPLRCYWVKMAVCTTERHLSLINFVLWCEGNPGDSYETFSTIKRLYKRNERQKGTSSHSYYRWQYWQVRVLTLKIPEWLLMKWQTIFSLVIVL